jgi:hypothetical protein
LARRSLPSSGSAPDRQRKDGWVSRPRPRALDPSRQCATPHRAAPHRAAPHRAAPHRGGKSHVCDRANPGNGGRRHGMSCAERARLRRSRSENQVECSPRAGYLGVHRDVRRRGLDLIEGSDVIRMGMGQPHRLRTRCGSVGSETSDEAPAPASGARVAGGRKIAQNWVLLRSTREGDLPPRLARGRVDPLEYQGIVHLDLMTTA